MGGVVVHTLESKKKKAIEIGVLFLLYTALGISVEVIFTGIADIIRDHIAGRDFDATMPCRASLWVIPVYAVSATAAFSIIGAWLPRLFSWPWWLRGTIYMIVIYCFEYIWALGLDNLLSIQVWNYENSEYHIWRYINPYFCVFWFAFGFALEKVKLVILPRLLKNS